MLRFQAEFFITVKRSSFTVGRRVFGSENDRNATVRILPSSDLSAVMDVSSPWLPIWRTRQGVIVC